MLNDSQVIVKVTREDTSSWPSESWVLHVNLASVSSFLAEYSSVEVVVRRPVTESTEVEAWMEIPRHKTNKHSLKTPTSKKNKKCNDQNTAHTRCQRVQPNSSQQNNLQRASLSERIKTSVYAIFINVNFYFLEFKNNKRDGERSPFPSATRGILFLSHVMFAGGLASLAIHFPSCEAEKK